MAQETPPYWRLLSVLFSTQSLTPALAFTLHEAALQLYRTEGSEGPVAGDLVSGRVRNLKKHVLLGSIGGPAFEAEIETARGKAQVRFLLTREGLEAMGVAAGREAMQQRAARPQYLN
ncbi:MAG TPA: hypothetical protein VK013_10535 [Myxococcaceae bacterium]|nr:hypothetical protein [Myxococcaceae bacterium]